MIQCTEHSHCFVHLLVPHEMIFLFCSSLEHFYICDNGTVSEKRSCQEDGRIFDPIARDCTETVLEGGDLWSFLFYNCFIIVKHICDPGCAMQCLPDCAQTRT